METIQKEDQLKECISRVRDLLDKQKLVEKITHRQQSANQELVESLVHRQHLAELKNLLEQLHTGDIAYILEALPFTDRMTLWQLIKHERGGDVLLEVSEPVRAYLIDALSPEDLMTALNQMDGDDLAYIADEIPKEALHARRETLTTDDQNWLRSALTYEEDTVGFLMSNEMVVVYETDTLELAAKTLRSFTELPIHNDQLFAVDRRGLLKGVLSLQTLLLKEPSLPVQKVMSTDFVKFSPYDDASDASQAFERYDLVSAPVVNERGKLIGRLTVDVVMDYIREETTEDVLSMAGVSGEEDLFAPILKSVQNRGLWLIVNLFAAIMVSRIIGLFESTTTHIVALAALMPIVSCIGGNTGNQTAALLIRAINLGQINSKNTFYLVRKEFCVSALNGAVLGTIVGLFAYIVYQSLALSCVIAVSMLLTLTVAAFVGLAVPIVLEKIGRDPALGSSIITTVTVDSVGFFIFLGLASLFLV